MMRLKLYLFRSLLRKSYLHVFMIFSIIIVGCTHTRHIPQHPLSDQLDEINKNLSGKKVEIVLATSSEHIAAENVYVAYDSVHYINTKTNMKKHIAASEVNKITIISHGKGAAEGFGIGMLSWVVLTVASVMIIGDKGPVEDGPPAIQVVAYYALVGGAPIPILTTFVGAARGSKKTYVFDDKENVSVKPVH